MAYLHKQPIGPSSKILKDLFVRDRERGQQQIRELLDVMMEPTHQAYIERREDLAGWVKALFTTEESFEVWCNKVSVYDESPLCGCVWTKDFVAYRCKTCATSPCMSVCAACFERGNHEGHEYNIFRSEAGGACDCGDSNVMKESGFCSRHGLDRVVPEEIPSDLLALPKLMMERMLIMFTHSLRYFVKDAILESSFPSKIPDPICETMDIFMTAIKCGSLIRSWVGNFLLSEEYYRRLLANEHYAGCISEQMINYHKSSHRWIPEAVKRLPMCPLPKEIKNEPRFMRNKFVYKTLLEEMTFWICRYEFPEHLILFILNMLPDDRIKRQFARYFAQHYIFIAPSLSHALHIDEYSNRIVHISVQLFSNSDLATMLAKEESLLEMFMISMNYMVTSKLVESKTGEADFHQTVSTSGEGLRNSAYWAIVSDFVNCLGHTAVTKIFLENDNALKIWMRVLTCFSGMNLTTRKTERHVEYDPQNILLPFYSEREACAAPLWVILNVLRQNPEQSYTVKVTNMCKVAIIELLDALGVDDPRGTAIPFKKFSFHYPIHRYFALFVASAVGRDEMKMTDLDLDERLARRIMAHPLAVLSILQEINCDMWVRNGMNISSQRLAYRQAFFCTFFVDADIFLLQLCSHYISPDMYVSSIFDRCRVTNCLTVEPQSKPIPQGMPGADGQPEDDRLPKMLEGAFYILLSTLSISTQLGLTDEEIIAQELTAVLSIQNWTYSQLAERVPQCHDMHGGEKSRRFTEPLGGVISRIARTVDGDAMTQTEYTLKDEYWLKYNPLFTDRRSLYKKNSQLAHTNYFKFLQRAYKLEPGTLESHVWPPYHPIRKMDKRYTGLANILNCRTLHTIIFMILYKYLQKHPVVSEGSLIMAVTLLEGALWSSTEDTPEEGQEKMEDSVQPPSSKRCREEQDWQSMLNQWFSSDNMTVNIRQVIDQVQLPADGMEIFHDAMETNEQLQKQPDMETSDPPDKCIVIQESILSLLIKLHSRYTGLSESFLFPADFVPDTDPPPVVPSTAPNVIGRILLLAASKSPENLKVIKDLCPVAQTIAPNVGDDEIKSEKDRRKQKAHEMQQKLLKEFASKQRRFLQQVEMELDLPGDGQEGENVDVEEDEKYQCVICGAMEDKTINITGITPQERGISAKSQIVALIGLAQASAVLGFRTESDELRPLIPLESDIVPPENCRKANQELYDVLKTKFPHQAESYTLGYNVDWEWAPQVSTCGHYVHVLCYQDYMKWVKKDESGYLRFDEGIGFQCPLCRQTSNVVLPCNILHERSPLPEEIRAQLQPLAPDRNLSEEDQLFQKRVWDVNSAILTNLPTRIPVLMEQPAPQQQHSGSAVDPAPMQVSQVSPVDEALKACDESVTAIFEEIKAALPKNTESRITPRGILQGVIEYELCHLGGTLRSDKKPATLSVVKRNIPLGPLFHVIVKNIRAKDEKPNNEYVARLWSQLAGTATNTREMKDCPLLLKDPIALLLDLCIAIYPFTVEEFQTVVRLLYNVCLVQSLAHIACQFSAEERRAWKSYVSVSIGGTPMDPTRLDCLMGLVIACLPRSLFEEASTSKATPLFTPKHYTSTVWTNQSVHNSLENFLLHFVRTSALIQFHVFKNHSTKQSFHAAPEGQSEFLFLAKYLNMTERPSLAATENLCTELAKWPASPHFSINQWCKEAEDFILADRYTSLHLLTRHRLWKQPTVVFLPDDYTNLFIKFRNITCPKCEYPAREPAVCLMCGQFICYKGRCQHSRDVYTDKNRTSKITYPPDGAAVHAKKCGNGTIVLLLVHSTTIVIVRGIRSTLWGTLYLDLHGEEDRGWKRGRKLLMRPERLKLLNYQWLNHIFDNACKGWTRHRLQL